MSIFCSVCGIELDHPIFVDNVAYGSECFKKVFPGKPVPKKTKIYQIPADDVIKSRLSNCNYDFGVLRTDRPLMYTVDYDYPGYKQNGKKTYCVFNVDVAFQNPDGTFYVWMREHELNKKAYMKKFYKFD